MSGKLARRELKHGTVRQHKRMAKVTVSGVIGDGALWVRRGPLVLRLAADALSRQKGA